MIKYLSILAPMTVKCEDADWNSEYEKLLTPISEYTGPNIQVLKLNLQAENKEVEKRGLERETSWVN